jgi:hypothetical protein
MPLPGRRQRLPDDSDTTQSEVRVVKATVASYNLAVHRATMKPIFSLMGIACSQLA